MGVKPGTVGMQVHITARSFGRVPITFQVMSVPPVPYALKLDFNPPGAWRAPRSDMSRSCWMKRSSFSCRCRRSDLALASPMALAQAWPTRTVTLLVPYAPGGGHDYDGAHRC